MSQNPFPKLYLPIPNTKYNNFFLSSTLPFIPKKTYVTKTPVFLSAPSSWTSAQGLGLSIASCQGRFPSSWQVVGEAGWRFPTGQTSYTNTPETNSKFAPENQPSRPKRKGSSANHPFLGAMLVSGRVKIIVLKQGTNCRYNWVEYT